MATRSSALGTILYASESAFGETTTTTGIRLDIVGEPSVDLTWEKIDPGILRQKPHEATQGINGIKGGSLSFEMLLTGCGSTTAAAATASALCTLLGHAWGQTGTSHAANLTATGGTAAVPTLSAASGIAAGSMVRIGAKGDARSDGQFAAVATHSGSDLTLLTAAPVAPDSGDQIYCTRYVYESSTPGTMDAITSLRFRFLSSRQQYLAHGCYMTACEFSNLSPGEVPRVRLTFSVARWAEVNATFPDTTSTNDFSGSPVAGGSFFFNRAGTATRATQSVRAFRWSNSVEQLPQMGPDAADEYQTVVGCVRGPSNHTFELEVDAEAAGTNTEGALWDNDPNSIASEHFLYSMSVADGRGLGLYVRNAKYIGSYPLQRAVNGQWRRVIQLQAMTGTTTTTDLTMSPWLLAFA